MSAPQQRFFKFGVELEFLLASIQASNCSRDSLFNEVRERLSETGVNSNICLSTDRSEERYGAWSITTEVTVQGAPGEHFRTYLSALSYWPSLKLLDFLYLVLQSWVQSSRLYHLRNGYRTDQPCLTTIDGVELV